MKIKIVKECQDGHGGRWLAVGDTLDISDERGQKAIAAGYAVADDYYEPKRGRRGYGENEQTEGDA